MQKHGLFIVLCYVFFAGCSLTAHQQFRRAELQRNAWKSLRFSGNMESDKRRFKQIIQEGKKLNDEYVKVLNFKKAEWSFAAAFRMAEIHELFAKKVESTPTPKNLSSKEQKKYRFDLQKITKRFKERAISSYQELIKKARNIRYYDGWVCRAEKRLALFYQRTLFADSLVCFPKHAEFSKQDGLQRFRDGQGILQAEGVFRNKRRHGPWTFWHSNGQKKLFCHYQDGKMHGSCRAWYSSGKTRIQGHFRHNQLHGALIAWYETGAKRLQITYVDGKKQGAAFQWHQNGAKKAEAHFKEDQLHGLMTEWYPSGQKRSESKFHTGKIEQLVTWYKDGKRETMSVFQDGKLHGKATGWHPNGNKKWEAHFQKGIRHGKKSNWHENGRLFSEEYLHEGKRHGLLRMWDESGQPSLEYQFRNGVQCGVSKLWDKYGKMTEKQVMTKAAPIVPLPCR